MPEIGSSGGSRTAFVADNKDIEPLLKMSVEELANVRILVYPAWIQHTLAIEKLEPYAKEPGCTIIHFKKPGASSPLFRWANALRFRILNTPAQSTAAESFSSTSRRQRFGTSPERAKI